MTRVLFSFANLLWEESADAGLGFKLSLLRLDELLILYESADARLDIKLSPLRLDFTFSLPCLK